MKRIMLVVVAVMVAPLLVMSQGTDATGIMTKVEQRYEQYDNMKIDFTQTIINPESDLEQESSGSLILEGENYKLESAGQRVISDGTKLWVYFEEENELVIDYANQEESFNPSDIFSLYKKDFKSAHAGNPTIDGTSTHVIIFSPRQTGDYDFHTIKLFINAKDYSIKKAELTDNMQNQVTYDIENMQTNLDLPADFFGFDPSQYEDIIVTDNTE